MKTTRIEEEPIIDIAAVNADIKALKAELVEVAARMEKYLKELGLE